MYWLSGPPVNRIVVPVSEFVEVIDSSVPVGGVDPLIFLTSMIGANVEVNAPLQSWSWIFTGMAAPYFQTLVGGPGLIGWRIPPPTTTYPTLTVAAFGADVPPSVSETVTDAAYGPDDG